ncbi:hypothetical protein ACFL3I_07075, partial [Pseudomonadota bacterium]
MNILLSLGSKIRFLHISKTPILILLVLGLLPGHAFAQTLDCSSTFEGSVGDGSDIFYLEEVELSATIGAGDIENGSYLDINEFTYGPDCSDTQGIVNCSSQGNEVVFNGISFTDCQDESGNVVNFTVSPLGVAPAPEVYKFIPNNPIRNFQPGEEPVGRLNKCNLKFSVSVIKLVNEDPPPPNSNSRLYQAFGWQLANGRCDNGQATGQNSNFSFPVSVLKIDIEKSTNGNDADLPYPDADVPILLVGDAVEWIYQVTNTGNVTLENIVVKDDLLGTIGGCPKTSLIPGESMDCTTPDGVATQGEYENFGDVIGSYTDPVNGDSVDVTDIDPSHYFAIDPSIALKKYISIDNGVSYADANV